MGSLHTDDDDYYFARSPASCSLSAFSTASQFGDSTLGNLNDIISDSSQIQCSSPSMQSNSTAEAYKSFDFLSNFPNENQLPAALSEYLLPAAEISPTPQNSSMDVHFSNYQELSNYSQSSLLPVGSENNWSNEVNDSHSNIEVNQTSFNDISGENGYQNGKTIPQGQGGRRGHRRRPNRSLSERGSIYRGVSRYTARFEAFLWDNTDPEEKSKTVYVGGFDNEEDAARAYDLAALKLWGKTAPINFPLSDYQKDLEEMQSMTKNEYLQSLRRKSRGFAKGTSIFRGVSRNSDNKKWQAKLGKGKGVKGLYIGTFDTEEEAAKAYDVASIRLKGMKAVTNFDLSNYNVKDITESARLPIGKGASKLIKKTPVEDVLLKKTNTRKTPRYYLHFGSSSSSQPNSMKKPFEPLQSLTARKNHLGKIPQNYNTTNQVLHQNPSSSYLNATHGLPRIGREDGTHDNLSVGYNFKLPINGVSDGHLAWMDTNKHINQVQFQSPNFPPNVYQNPNYQNRNFLHESMNVESGLESDGFISGYLNGEFPVTELFDGNAMLTKNVDSAISYGGFQQMESLQNFQFHQDRNVTNHCQNQNSISFPLGGIQNLESQTLIPDFGHDFTGVQRDNYNANFCTIVGELPSSGVSRGSLAVMGTNKNYTNDRIGGFLVEGPILEHNLTQQGIENGELCEDSGQDNQEFEIPSSCMDGDFLDEFPLF